MAVRIRIGPANPRPMAADAADLERQTRQLDEEVLPAVHA